jgi:hypothetical protein
VEAGGYVTSVNWHGYAWTSAVGTGSTVAPTDFSSLGSGGQLCAQGSVAGSADEANVAELSININQAEALAGTAPPIDTYTPTGTGIAYNIANNGASLLRLQIQAADGATNAADRWCATIEGGTGTVPWAAFNTECWGVTGGTAYAGQPIATVIVQVPGSSVATPFDICINSITEAGAICGVTSGSSSDGGADDSGADGTLGDAS